MSEMASEEKLEDRILGEEQQPALITVIIPIYKVEKYLCRCVDSVRNQTYENLEIILVDDGSPDGCGAICDEYANGGDNRIKVIHKQNGGLSDARNAGIEAASGEYLAFVDSDDYIHPQMYEKMYAALSNADADMAICNFKFVYESMPTDGTIQENFDLPIKDGVLIGNEILENKLFGYKSHYWVVAWNKLYKRELFDALCFPKRKLHEDAFVAHRIYGMCDKVACVSDMLYAYVQRTGSIMSEKYNLRRLDAVEALIDRCQYLLERGTNPVKVSDVLSDVWFRFHEGYLHFDRRKYQGSVRYQELWADLKRLVRQMPMESLNRRRRLWFRVNYYSPYLAWKLSKCIMTRENKWKRKILEIKG